MSERPSKAALLETFRLFNECFFGGLLPDIAIHCRRMRHTDGLSYDPCDDYEHGRIVINLDNNHLSGWRGILAHEMIHAWLDLCGVDEFEHGEVAYHGPVFHAECTRIGRLLGLPDVDEDECWAWPDSCFEAVLVPVVEE